VGVRQEIRVRRGRQRRRYRKAVDQAARARDELGGQALVGHVKVLSPGWLHGGERARHARWRVAKFLAERKIDWTVFDPGFYSITPLLGVACTIVLLSLLLYKGCGTHFRARF
jgi:hypothetical protein